MHHPIDFLRKPSWCDCAAVTLHLPCVHTFLSGQRAWASLTKGHRKWGSPTRSSKQTWFLCVALSPRCCLTWTGPQALTVRTFIRPKKLAALSESLSNAMCRFLWQTKVSAQEWQPRQDRGWGGGCFVWNTPTIQKLRNGLFHKIWIDCLSTTTVFT